MFDIGFSEVLLIFVLALIVLGPEKLPKVAAQVGRWIGRARGMARQFREQLEEEVNLEEIRRTQQPANRAPSPSPVTPSSASETAPTETHPSTSGSPPPYGDAGAHDPGASGAATTYPSDSSLHASGSVPTSAPTGTASYATPLPPEPEPPQPVYPDYYSHAHPTDTLGRPIPAPTNEPPPPESGQQDWVGGVTGTEEKSAQAGTDGAYASAHERGT
jgi:sec-independent protein translocase protein TatB